jgi:hypothetical protein
MHARGTVVHWSAPSDWQRKAVGLVLWLELILAACTFTGFRTSCVQSHIGIARHVDSGSLAEDVRATRLALNQLNDDVTSCVRASSRKSRMELVKKAHLHEDSFVKAMNNLPYLGGSEQSVVAGGDIIKRLEQFRLYCSIVLDIAAERSLTGAQNDLLTEFGSESQDAVHALDQLLSRNLVHDMVNAAEVRKVDYATLLMAFYILPLLMVTLIHVVRRFLDHFDTVRSNTNVYTFQSTTTHAIPCRLPAVSKRVPNRATSVKHRRKHDSVAP